MRRFSGDRLLVATHNQGKLSEFRNILNLEGISLVSSFDLGLPEPIETETSFIGNARIKAHAGAAVSGLPTLADDSGICVTALNGAPGVYTADWAATPSGRDFMLAMEKTWNSLEEIDAPHPRHAIFHCTLVLAWPDGHDEVFEGEMGGNLVWPIRGREGHGYDPMFEPLGSSMTFAEMSLQEKDAISHRAIAVRKLIGACFT